MEVASQVDSMDYRASESFDDDQLSHNVALRRGSQVVCNYRGLQSDETNILLRDCPESPDDYVLSIERYSYSIASIVGFGRRIDRVNDPIAQYALAFMEVADVVIPGQALMEVISSLIRLPWWMNPIPSMIGKASPKDNKYV